jgi:hypothetical protein
MIRDGQDVVNKLASEQFLPHSTGRTMRLPDSKSGGQIEIKAILQEFLQGVDRSVSKVLALK